MLWSDDEHREQTPPGESAGDLEWLLCRQDQVATRRQLLRLMSSDAIEHLVARGRWQRAGWGVIVAHNGPLTRLQQMWAACLGAGDGAVIGGVTAAMLEGLRGYDRKEIHILVPARRRARLGGTAALTGTRVVLHRSTVLSTSDLREVGQPPRTVIARSIVDAAAWCGTDDDARAIVAAAFQQHRVTGDEIREVLRRLPRARRRAIVAETVRNAEGGAEAPSEVDFSRLCRRFGLPRPDLQDRRLDASAGTRLLDVYWRRWGLHVAIDGSWHMGVEQLWADLKRQNDIWRASDRVLRFPAWAVRHRSGEVAEQVRQALIGLGWRS